ncbi:MAG TPA: tetratricopeptide repeat protein [Polyangiaceae bacterium]|nr:tetratricopeptide repeat protein [Polyangiaceae bacterium]
MRVLLTLVSLVVACKSAVPLPEKALGLNTAGIEALAQGDLETADARFSLALEYSPEFVDALVNLGLVELERGNFERARQLFERARRLNPDVAQSHHALGVLAERQGRPDQASKHYYEALRVDPGFAPARANLGRLLFADGALEEALVQFKRLAEVAPEDPGGYAGSCETLLRLGRVTEAEAVLAGAARFRDVPELELLRARSALRRGDVEQAVALLSPLARGRGDMAVAALGWLATAELARQRFKHAVGAARRALELEPQDSVATYALAVALAELGAPDARPWLKRAAQNSPGDPVLSRWLDGN